MKILLLFTKGSFFPSFNLQFVMSKVCDGSVGLGLQANTNLDRDRQLHDTSVVKFLSSYNEGSQSVGYY